MAAKHSDLTIDELARESGMTVRNIRAHQARGLLPAPEVRARTGFYGPDHVERLRLIADMQAEGFNLKAIERILESEDQDGRQLLELSQSARDAFLVEEPEFTTLDDLAERFGPAMVEDEINSAVKAGLLVPVGEGRFEVPSPTLLAAGEALVQLGVPVNEALAAANTIVRQSRRIATALIRLFVENVLDKGDSDWERNRDALELLKPLAAEAVRAAFQQAMATEIEREVTKRLG